MEKDLLLMLGKSGAASARSRLAERLLATGAQITREEALALAARRDACLRELERIEFGEAAVVLLAQELTGTSVLTHGDVAHTLDLLQESFYALRDELPLEVPDQEIAEALRGFLEKAGDAQDIAGMECAQIMAYSKDYRRADTAQRDEPYRLTDPDGRTYAFGPAGWDVLETTCGWDGEAWADDLSE